ncbi:MAG TPA: hypothetical protein H9943_01430 [Candidatus Ruthenibacterium avium]|uniref:Uncharacterized protein n=1 Tax=Candidatus Ruthenibacterium avium TaxID=2838751 RepID=A0A9D2M1E3_9FIRM|nr:hypothetical protein [Candidatus Ruthenibacterium avium]
MARFDLGSVQGPAATVAVGGVQTVSFEASAQVYNTGDEHAAVFHFQIPRGEKGDRGERGPTGDKAPSPRFELREGHLYVQYPDEEERAWQ